MTPVSSNQPLPETVEHSFDFVDLLVELAVLFGTDVGQVASQKDLVLDLAGRAGSQTQEVSQLAVSRRATPSAMLEGSNGLAGRAG